ncbi:MAG: hypothetical protein KDD37_02535 [Bdellovibrionales bacterium]|nr:hypothetical protein [Bdellovibrionales bacterium]
MLKVFLALLFIGNNGFSNPEISSPGALCSDIFNRNITDMNLNIIDQLRDESVEALATYLKEVGAFKAFSKDELYVLARLIKKEEHKDKPTDMILDIVTENISNTRSQLQVMVRDRIEREVEDPSEIEMALEKIRKETLTESPAPNKENYVNIGNIGDAKIAHGIYRYMVLKPWDVSQFTELHASVESKGIAIANSQLDKGILAIVHPADLIKLSKMSSILMEVNPFSKDPSEF